jgi:hypothetical protein
MIPISENWIVKFPKYFIWPDDEIKPENIMATKPACKYKLVAKGTPSKKGHYGHKGGYHRKFDISEVIELKKI